MTGRRRKYKWWSRKQRINMFTTKDTKNTKFVIKNIRILRGLHTTMVESFRSLRKFCADSKLMNQ
jgi:hypothetical protein